MEKLLWIFLLICMVLIAMYALYKNRGMDYSAGQGFWKKSSYSLEEEDKDLSDYDPYNYDNLRK